MVASNSETIRFFGSRFGYEEACEVARSAVGEGAGRIVRLDLGGTSRTTTAALARLILLRRSLLAGGRDMRITGLSGPAEGLYEISRLENLLPRAGAGQA